MFGGSEKRSGQITSGTEDILKREDQKRRVGEAGGPELDNDSGSGK